MNTYEFHYSGYYGYDITVKAEDEDEARELADSIFEDTTADEFLFEPSGTELVDVY